MSLKIVNSSVPEGELEWCWIAHPRCYDPSPLERQLIARRAELYVVGVLDDGFCDGFDEHALVRLDNEFYWLNTSGCSCGSSCADWRVCEVGTLAQIEVWVEARIAEDTALNDGMFLRYTDEFRALLKAARS